MGLLDELASTARPADEVSTASADHVRRALLATANLEDPFSVAGEPEVRDGSARLVPRIAGLLRFGAREAVIAAHLRAGGTQEVGATGEADPASRRIVDRHDRLVASLPHGRPSAAGRMPHRRTTR